MGAQPSSQQTEQSSDHVEVITVDSAEDWKIKLQNSKASNKLMVIDFAAEWCGPCKFIEPAIQDLAAEFKNVDFFKIDIDKLKDVAKDYDVQALPTIVLIKKGKERERIVGVKKGELRKMIEKHSS